MKPYRNITAAPAHAISFASGEVVAPGGVGDSDMKDAHDQALLEDGFVVAAAEAKPKASKATTSKEQSK